MMGDSSILQGRYELIYLTLSAIFITYLYANKFTVIGMGEISKKPGLIIMLLLILVFSAFH